jgi:hypothetical protein
VSGRLAGAGTALVAGLRSLTVGGVIDDGLRLVGVTAVTNRLVDPHQVWPVAWYAAAVVIGWLLTWVAAAAATASADRYDQALAAFEPGDGVEWAATAGQEE